MNKNKKYRSAKITSAIIASFLLLTSISACSDNEKTEFPPKSNVVISSTQNHNYSSSRPVNDLSNINATFSDTTWLGEKYVKIDEESLLQIIRLAMKDAEKMYKSIGSFNMKLHPITNKHTDTFYPDWMNEYFFLSRAKKESVYMINYVGEPVENGYRAKGIMQIIPEYVVPTLNEYMTNIYNSDITFDKFDLLPSKSDIANYKTSSKARENLKQDIYDSVFTSICYDIYNAKCTGPNHEDYYDKFGGYKESIRNKVVTALYLFRRDDVISSLQNGSFLNTYGSSQYVNDILSYQQEAKNNHENSSQFGN